MKSTTKAIGGIFLMLTILLVIFIINGIQIKNLNSKIDSLSNSKKVDTVRIVDTVKVHHYWTQQKTRQYFYYLLELNRLKEQFIGYAPGWKGSYIGHDEYWEQKKMLDRIYKNYHWFR